MTSLSSAREQYAEQQRISLLGARQATRAAERGAAQFAAIVRAYQRRSIDLSLAAVPLILGEQSIDESTVATPAPQRLLTEPAALADLAQRAESQAAVTLLAQSFITNASRTATLVGAGVRPATTGYVRHLRPPSCARCAVLAGRVYRYSTGFRRHPRCDCLMTPTTEAAGRDLVTDPEQMFERGQIRGLSRADTTAIRDGADLGQVVNVRRQQAGLTSQGSVLVRAGRLTPEGIYRQASGADAIALLRQHGYVL